MRRWELGVFAAVMIALIGGAAVARFVPGDPVPQPSPIPGRFLSSGWYCPLPPVDHPAYVATTNLGTDPVQVRRWALGEGRESDKEQVQIEPRSRAVTNMRAAPIPNPAAVLEVFGAQATADSLTVGPSAVTATRCSVQPSDQWYFSTGSTARGKDTFLLVQNPFEEEAIVRVRFMTPEKDVTPALLRDHLIPQLSQTAIFLPEFFEETEDFGMQVTAVRGRVVVARYQRVARDGFNGAFSDIGIREPSRQWYFAGGRVPSPGSERIVLVNPTDREALLQVVVHTADGATSIPDLQEVAVPAGRQVTLDMGTYLPPGAEHGTVITSLNDVPFVVERVTTGDLGGGKGVDSVFGVPVPARRMVLSVGSPAGGSDSLSMMSPSRGGAVVRITLLTEAGPVNPPELAAITVPSGVQVVADITPFLGGGAATAIVEAITGEIVVERHLVVSGDFADGAGQVFD